MNDLKNQIKEFAKKESTFLCLAAGWVLFAIIIPILAVNHKYHLFIRTEENGVRFTGWILVAFIILFAGLYALCSYVIEAYSVKYRTWVKLLKGFQRIILPLILMYLLTDLIADNINDIKKVLWWIIASEIIAVIINPFPYFIYKHKNKDLREVYGLQGKD